MRYTKTALLSFNSSFNIVLPFSGYSKFCKSYLGHLVFASTAESPILNAFLAHHLLSTKTRCNTMLSRVDEVIALFVNPKPLEDIPEGRTPRAAAVADWLESEDENTCNKGDADCNVRERRQFLFGLGILAGVGIFALGSYLFSKLKLIDLSMSVAGGPNDLTVESLQDHERRISINEAALNHTQSALTALAEVVKLQEEEAVLYRTVLNAEGAMISMESEIWRLLEGLKELSHMKFSSKLVPVVALRGAIGRLEDRLDALGLQILPTQTHEFYELDTSFLAFTNMTIRVFLHVPAYTRGTLLNLYRFIPCPLTVGNDRVFLPSPVDNLLALNIRNHVQFRTMTLTDLALCKSSGNRYYCPGQNFYRKKSGENCLMNLFNNQLKAVVDNCRFKPLGKDQDYLIQLSATDFLLFHHGDYQVSMTCRDSIMRAVNFSGLRKLIVPPGCMVTTRSFTFEGEIDILMLDQRLTPHFQLAENFSAVVPSSVKTAKLSEVINQASLIGSEKGVKIKDLARALIASRTVDTWEFSLGIVGTIVLLLVICFIIFCCCCTSAGNLCASCKQTCTSCMTKNPPTDRSEHDEHEMRAMPSAGATPATARRGNPFGPYSPVPAYEQDPLTTSLAAEYYQQPLTAPAPVRAINPRTQWSDKYVDP